MGDLLQFDDIESFCYDLPRTPAVHTCGFPAYGFPIFFISSMRSLGQVQSGETVFPSFDF